MRWGKPLLPSFLWLVSLSVPQFFRMIPLGLPLLCSAGLPIWLHVAWERLFTIMCYHVTQKVVPEPHVTVIRVATVLGLRVESGRDGRTGFWMADRTWEDKG